MDAAPESFQKQTVVFLVWRQQDFCTHKNNAVLCSPPNRLYETGSKLMPWNPFTFSRSVPASGIFRTYLRSIPVSRERQAQRLRVMSSELQRRHSSGTAQAGVPSSSCPAFIWKAPEQRTRNVAGPAIWRGSRPPCSLWHCKHLLPVFCPGFAFLQYLVCITRIQLRGARKVIKIKGHLITVSETEADSIFFFFNFWFIFFSSRAQGSGLWFLLQSTLVWNACSPIYLSPTWFLSAQVAR